MGVNLKSDLILDGEKQKANRLQYESRYNSAMAAMRNSDSPTACHLTASSWPRAGACVHVSTVVETCCMGLDLKTMMPSNLLVPM